MLVPFAYCHSTFIVFDCPPQTDNVLEDFFSTFKLFMVHTENSVFTFQLFIKKIT